MLQKQKKFLEYLGKCEPLASSLPENDIVPLKQKIMKTELIVPVVGAFSAGKSSLLNAFLGSEVLPVGIIPETELATEIRYSPESYLLGIKEDGSEERFSIDDLSEINRRSKEFLFLRIYLDNPPLKAIAPLVLVDMPGFGSSLENHNKAISFYMPRGVHFILVTSIEDGSITKSMLRQLEEIRSYGVKFSFVLSKTDLRAKEQVDEVRDYIQDQLSLELDDTCNLGLVSTTNIQPFQKTLQDIDPESIFHDLFIEVLKEQNISLIKQINLALNTLQHDESKRKEALKNLEDALNSLESHRGTSMKEIKQKFSRTSLDRCLKDADKALQDALDELVTFFVKKDEQGLSRTISDVIRNSLTQSLRAETEKISESFADNLAEYMPHMSMDLFSGTDNDWAMELSRKVQDSLKAATGSLSNWKDALEKSSFQTGGLYKLISTVAAITTSIVNPLVELVIVFLPELLGLFRKGNARDKASTKIQTEVFPSIKAELRKSLPPLLDKELQRLLEIIQQEFESQINKQKEVINAFHEEHDSSHEANKQKIAELEEVRSEITALSNEYLYSE